MIANPDEVNDLLSEMGIDVLIATSLKNVYYTSGIWTTPTVTPGPENHAKTGLYTDYSPPKSASLWAAGDSEPAVVIPPVVTTHIPDEGIDLQNDSIYIYGRRSVDPTNAPDHVSSEVQRVFDLFETTYADRAEAIAAVLEGVDGRDLTIALEQSSTSIGPVEDSSMIYEAIESALPEASIVEGTGVLQRLRLTKNREEIDRLRTAAQVTEGVMMDSLEWLKPGMTEREFATRCKQEIYERGGLEQMWLDHNHIGFGHRTAYPHVVPSDKPLEEGDLIRFEFGGRFERYPSDLARTFAFGSTTEKLEDRYQVIYSAMERCKSLLADHEDTDVILRRTIDHLQEEARSYGIADLEDYSATMIGHNMGLDIHDPPLISDEPVSIEPGMVMNYELMDVQWGIGGIQLEDTLLVTKDGVESFTQCPDSLLVV